MLNIPGVHVMRFPPMPVNQRIRAPQRVNFHVYSACVSGIVVIADLYHLHSRCMQILVHETYTSMLVTSLKGHQGKIRREKR